MLKVDLFNGQMIFIWVFFVVMMQLFMEDILILYLWVLIIYILLVMVVYCYDEMKVMEEYYDIEELYDDMNVGDLSYEE